jgi:hypothetical protein
VTLATGEACEWFVSVLAESEPGPADAVARAGIERVGAEAQGRTVSDLARAGLWYDALETASADVASTPKAPPVRRVRAALLEQAGLHAVAAVDRAAGSGKEE